MKNPLQKVKTLILALPEKDARLCEKYLSERNFEAILEIVESDIYKARKEESEDSPNESVSTLIKLRDELVTYMSYLEIPDDSDDYYDY